MCPSVGLDHSKPRTATNDPSAFAASASAPMRSHSASSIPTACAQPWHESPCSLPTPEWSVRAATSRPCDRIDANASSARPSPSDRSEWLCRSACTSRMPFVSFDWRAAAVSVDGPRLRASAPGPRAMSTAPDATETPRKVRRERSTASASPSGRGEPGTRRRTLGEQSRTSAGLPRRCRPLTSGRVLRLNALAAWCPQSSGERSVRPAIEANEVGQRRPPMQTRGRCPRRRVRQPRARRRQRRRSAFQRPSETGHEDDAPTWARHNAPTPRSTSPAGSRRATTTQHRRRSRPRRRRPARAENAQSRPSRECLSNSSPAGHPDFRSATDRTSSFPARPGDAGGLG